MSPTCCIRITVIKKKIRNRLIALNQETKGDFLQMYQVIKADEQLKTYAWADDVTFAPNILTILDEDYPYAFKQLKMPPFVLYYEGDVTLLQHQTLSIIGSRNPSQYAQQMCQSLCETLSPQRVVVSSLDVGISFIALQTFSKRGSVIGVLPSSLDRMYPIESYDLFQHLKQTHCLITEYPEKTVASVQTLRARERLLCALSQEIICIEPSAKGAMINSVLDALEQGTCVYVLPDQLGQRAAQGTFKLLEHGALCLTEISTFM